MQCIFLDNIIIDTIKYYNNDTLAFELCPPNNGIRNWIYYDGNDTIIGFSKKNEAGLYRYYDEMGTQLDSNMYDILKSLSEFYPHYYGGGKEMLNYLGNSELKNLKKGTYYVSFVVNKNGNIEKVKVLNSKKKKVLKIIAAVFEEMPRWQPAHQRGIMVNATMNIPLNLK